MQWGGTSDATSTKHLSYNYLLNNARNASLRRALHISLSFIVRTLIQILSCLIYISNILIIYICRMHYNAYVLVYYVFLSIWVSKYFRSAQGARKKASKPACKQASKHASTYCVSVSDCNSVQATAWCSTCIPHWLETSRCEYSMWSHYENTSFLLYVHPTKSHPKI